MAVLILCNKTTHSSPITRYSKPSTLRLLSEMLINKSGAFLNRLPNGELKASFLYSGQNNHAPNNFPVKAGSTIYVKKSNGDVFKRLRLKGNQRKLVENGVAFSIYTKSKSGLKKEINISIENENIIVNSTKGYGTPDYVLKRTVLEFGDSASTSSQSSSSNPKITIKRYSISDKTLNIFDTKETSIYNPLNLKLISKTTKNKTTKQSESITINRDNTKIKIIKNSDGSSSSTTMNSNDEILFSKENHGDGNITITKRLEDGVYLSQKYDQNSSIVEETLTTSKSSDTKKYDERGSLTSTTSSYKLSDGSNFETTVSSSEATTYEHRNDGSLLSIIIRTSSGELLKQNFDTNNKPLDDPYKIN